MKVLVVEDEDIIRESIKMDILRLRHQREYEVHMAASVHEAEFIYETQKPELIITDVNMPRISGLTLVEKIRRKDNNCIIIVLSAYDNYEFVHQAFLSGANDYILKPIAFSELDAKIKSLFDDKAPNDSYCSFNDSSDMLCNATIQNVLEYIEKNISRSISMSDVANVFSISYSHFSKLFRQHTKMTFPKYLLKKRMEKAAEYLCDTNIRIALVAKKVGYGDNAHHFSRDFNKFHGVTPSDYQIKHNL